MCTYKRENTNKNPFRNTEKKVENLRIIKILTFHIELLASKNNIKND